MAEVGEVRLMFGWHQVQFDSVPELKTNTPKSKSLVTDDVENIVSKNCHVFGSSCFKIILLI